ncbi:MAG: NAD(P)/FAD-dependent oxidoreductase, partial [Candidatus Eisenbacteria bacterium]
MHDLIVVGAGPAGSTISSLVKKNTPQARVLLLEKAVFPRHHIGESLLSGILPILKELGVLDKMKAAGFVKKVGAIYVWGKDRKPWDADFSALNAELGERFGAQFSGIEFPWQVLRSRYDQVLAEHAQSLGVEARFGWRALAPIEKGGVVVGLTAQDPEGRTHALHSRMLADCSGQDSFLSQVRRTRRYRDDLKNVALYAYFKGADWKFKFVGRPDESKIFVCSVPEGWFWYIPVEKDLVSVGLVMKASYLKELKPKDPREFYWNAVQRCVEIAPLLSRAEWRAGVDPHDAARDFFTIGDWSFENGLSCGPGWLAAGDAAFFVDPLLSSGVMMAHLSGHRAAYTINTLWKGAAPAVEKELWKDYSRFCREAAQSYFTMVRYWYYNEPHAKSWWGAARKALGREGGVHLRDRSAFTAVAAGWPYFLERSYTFAGFFARPRQRQDARRKDALKHELKSWVSENLAILEPGFLAPKKTKAASAPRPAALDESLTPILSSAGRRSVSFLPLQGRLYAIARLDWKAKNDVSVKRVLPDSYLAILKEIDGRRSVREIVLRLKLRLPLPAEVIERQIGSMIADLQGMGILALKRLRAKAPTAEKRAPMAAFRRGESALREGRV